YCTDARNGGQGGDALRAIKDSSLLQRWLRPIVANVFFDHGEAIGDAIKRVPGMRHIGFEIELIAGPWSDGFFIRAYVFDEDEQIGQSALDCMEVAQPGIRSIQPFG